MPSTPTSDRQEPNSRRALIEAAIEEFAEKGYAAATLADIAGRAGVTTGAVYAHFDSKIDLLVAALGLRSAQKFVDVAFRAGDVASGRMVDNLAAGLLSAMLGRRGLILLDVIVFARRDAEVAAALAEMVDVRQRTFEEMTGAAVAAGVIEPKLSHEELGRLVMALAFGTLVQRALGEPAPGSDTVAHLAECLLRPTPEGADDTAPALARVFARSHALHEAEQALHAAIAAGAAAGHSLRALARAAGISHERVRVILAAHETSP